MTMARLLIGGVGPGRVCSGSWSGRAWMWSSFTPTAEKWRRTSKRDGFRRRSRSLKPWRSVTAEWRKEFLYENYQDPEYPEVTFHILSLRTEFAKRVEYPGRPEWTQVCDLRVDPLEMRNLAQDPSAAALAEDLRLRLAAAVRRLRPEGAR